MRPRMISREARRGLRYLDRSGRGLAPGGNLGTMRIVSFLPSATDMIAELGLLDSLVGVSEDCNWPPEVASKPLVARTRIDVSGLTGSEIDRLVSASCSESHSLYAVDAQLME